MFKPRLLIQAILCCAAIAMLSFVADRQETARTDQETLASIARDVARLGLDPTSTSSKR